MGLIQVLVLFENRLLQTNGLHRKFSLSILLCIDACDFLNEFQII